MYRFIVWKCVFQVALAQHSRARKPLVREYPVGDTTEVRPNNDSSWSSTSSDVPRPSEDIHSDPAEDPNAITSVEPGASHDLKHE